MLDGLLLAAAGPIKNILGAVQPKQSRGSLVFNHNPELLVLPLYTNLASIYKEFIDLVLNQPNIPVQMELVVLIRNDNVVVPDLLDVGDPLYLQILNVLEPAVLPNHNLIPQYYKGNLLQLLVVDAEVFELLDQLQILFVNFKNLSFEF